MRRRSFLATVAAAGIAGCGGQRGEQTAGTPGTTTTEATEPPAETPTPTASDPRMTTTAGDLDLREANVTAVAVERVDGGYRFDVTLLHDDDGEDGYANWWQVESLDGDRLGRRDLLHAHGTREFTRSTTVEMPDGVDCVVVRGHDRTHGYGGQAVLANVDTGATRAIRQGAEPETFSAADCP